MQFSFGILTYNSEKYILQTLYSIKYQIEHFGQDYSIQLVIGDDASNDNTVSIINKWLDKYYFLFDDIVKNYSLKNSGTVSNYNNVIDSIKSEHFHIIAGDDLYAPNNIFEISSVLKNNEVITSFPLSMDDSNCLFLDRHRLARNVQMMRRTRSGKEMVKKIIFGSYVHTPSTLFLKNLYSSDIKKYVSNFKLFEDDPKWYMFAKNGMSFKYVLKPFVIYRYHSNSIAHSNVKTVNNAFLKDRMRLLEQYKKDENCTFLLRKYIESEEKDIKSSSKNVSLYKIFRECDYLSALTIDSFRGEWIGSLNKMKKNMLNAEEYIQLICKQSSNEGSYTICK